MSSGQQIGQPTPAENVAIDTPLHHDPEKATTHHYDSLEHTERLSCYDDVNDIPQEYSSAFSPHQDDGIEQLGSNETQTAYIDQLGVHYDYNAVPRLMNSPSLDNEQKLAILKQCPHPVLNRLYEQHMAAHGLRQPSTARTSLPKTNDLNEENYQPLITDNEPSPAANAPRPIYPAYAGHFMGAQDAKMYRKRIRIAPKAHAPDVERVKRYGRKYPRMNCTGDNH